MQKLRNGKSILPHMIKSSILLSAALQLRLMKNVVVIKYRRA
jgi:hypothetical protein